MICRFEPFKPGHAPGVKSVYDHYAMNGFALFSQEPADDYFLRYLEQLSVQGYPVYSLLCAKEQVGGYAFFAPYGHGAAFKHVAMVSMYLLPEHLRQGYGGRLLRLLQDKARQRGIKTVLASVVADNHASQAFFSAQGFNEVGRFKAVGRKFDRTFDQIWLQKAL